MQHRIITPGPLHDENGRLIETGYATRLIKTYDRGRIAARPFRIKEWDYYAVCTDRFALALTIDHNGYMTMDSISLLDFEENSQVTSSRISLPAFAKRSLPPTSAKGDIRVAGKGYEISFENDGSVRHLRGYMDRFTKDSGITFDLALTDAPEESMVIVTPFRNHPEAFYYNQKINCMRVSGQIRHREKSTVERKSFSLQTVPSLARTLSGDASSISIPTIMETACHSASASSTAPVFCRICLFIDHAFIDEVKILD